ncbi:hypothetical protein [Halomarina litorea]|uniref:hypothetical protein n=1 Tax=Halomarina litorea TaxID=2961595 RepID=UPI0020C51D19|nr:hypothetical protein [Halomarina sp. BCD28]
MTRAATESGLFDAVDAIVEATYDEFDAVRAVRRGSTNAAGRAVDALLKQNRLLDEYVVRPEIEGFREDARRQVSAMLDAVAAGDPVETRRETILAADAYYGNLGPETPAETRAAVADAVVGRFERAGETVEPVVASPEESFWDAVRASLTAEEARTLVAANFEFAPEMRPYREWLDFRTDLTPSELLGGPLAARLPTLSVDYTDESMRAMRRAETRVRHEYDREIARRYGD